MMRYPGPAELRREPSPDGGPHTLAVGAGRAFETEEAPMTKTCTATKPERRCCIHRRGANGCAEVISCCWLRDLEGEARRRADAAVLAAARRPVPPVPTAEELEAERSRIVEEEVLQATEAAAQQRAEERHHEAEHQRQRAAERRRLDEHLAAERLDRYALGLEQPDLTNMVPAAAAQIHERIAARRRQLEANDAARAEAEQRQADERHFRARVRRAVEE